MKAGAGMTFGESVIAWFQENKRELPWRHTTDPYKIWLSEIILQQTRVDQGLSYYNRFVSAFPEVHNLAKAKEDDVLKLWQGLGYYSRARNLHHAAKEIMTRFKGKFPEDYDEILSLKGIGEYTASAIASFAFQKRHAVVDGNVFRVLSRYLGIAIPINSPRAKKQFNTAALELMSASKPHDFNQAIMEFGALQCKPQKPDCRSCPLNGSCFAFSKNRVGEFPVKDKKVRIRKRYFNYLCITNGNNIHLRRRTGNDIWKNMYDFPLIETTRKISTGKLMELEEWKKHFPGNRFHLISESKTIKHQLTHQTIFAKFFEIRTEKIIQVEGVQTVRKSGIHKFAVPRLIENYLKSGELVL